MSLLNLAFGGPGNDKIIGGITTDQYLYGDEGDDKIWVINPEQRGMEIFSDETDRDNEAKGGYGNDHIFGSDAADRIIGDIGDINTTDDEYIYGSDDDYYNQDGGDDVIFGYGGDDLIFGLVGDDVLDGGDGDDLLIGHRGNDKLFG